MAAPEKGLLSQVEVTPKYTLNSMVREGRVQNRYPGCNMVQIRWQIGREAVNSTQSLGGRRLYIYLTPPGEAYLDPC